MKVLKQLCIKYHLKTNQDHFKLIPVILLTNIFMSYDIYIYILILKMQNEIILCKVAIVKKRTNNYCLLICRIYNHLKRTQGILSDIQ